MGLLLDRGSLIGWSKKARLIYTPQVSAAAILDGNSLAGATVTLARIVSSLLMSIAIEGSSRIDNRVIGLLIQGSTHRRHRQSGEKIHCEQTH